MSTIKANTLLHSDGSTTTQPSIPALDKRMAKAWINMDMSTGVIKDSYGVSSITDGGTGNWYVTFSTAQSDTNYCVVNNSGWVESTGGQIWVLVTATVDTTARFRILARYIDNDAPSFAIYDEPKITAAVFSS